MRSPSCQSHFFSRQITAPAILLQAILTGGIAAVTVGFVTLTLELSDLRSANEKALAQLGRTTEEEFDAELGQIENFLVSIYRIAVLDVRGKRKLNARQMSGAKRLKSLIARPGRFNRSPRNIPEHTRH